MGSKKIAPQSPEKKLEELMANKIIDRWWKEGLIELVWTILSNNRVFSVEKFFMNKVLLRGGTICNGYDLENNLLHLSEEYTDDNSILNICYNKKSLGSLWDDFPNGVVNGSME